MKRLNANRNAFPDEVNSGLTKREYFAGLIMQSFATDSATNDYASAAQYAIRAADALLKALEANNE